MAKFTEADKTSCRICGSSLTIENQYEAYRKLERNECKPCSRTRAREWGHIHKEQRAIKNAEWRKKNLPQISQNNKEKWQQLKSDPVKLETYYKKMRDYIRNNRLNNKDGNRGVTHKRHYPFDEKCEVCGRGQRRLGYHHWDDNDYSKGIWVCIPCHNLAEGFDAGRVGIYANMKSVLSKNKNIMVI